MARPCSLNFQVSQLENAKGTLWTLTHLLFLGLLINIVFTAVVLLLQLAGAVMTPTLAWDAMIQASSGKKLKADEEELSQSAVVVYLQGLWPVMMSLMAIQVRGMGDSGLAASLARFHVVGPAIARIFMQ